MAIQTGLQGAPTFQETKAAFPLLPLPGHPLPQAGRGWGWRRYNAPTPRACVKACVKPRRNEACGGFFTPSVSSLPLGEGRGQFFGQTRHGSGHATVQFLRRFSHRLLQSLRHVSLNRTRRNELPAFKILPRRRVVERGFSGLGKRCRLWKNRGRTLNTRLSFFHLAFLVRLLERLRTGFWEGGSGNESSPTDVKAHKKRESKRHCG